VDSRHPWDVQTCSCGRLTLSGGPKHRRVQWRAEPGTGWTDLGDEHDPAGARGASPTGAADAHESLSKVLGYVGSVIVESACAHIPEARNAMGPDGLIADPSIRARLGEVLGALLSHLEHDRALGITGQSQTTT
jgi:hypothetical protein